MSLLNLTSRTAGLSIWRSLLVWTFSADCRGWRPDWPPWELNKSAVWARRSRAAASYRRSSVAPHPVFQQSELRWSEHETVRNSRWMPGPILEIVDRRWIEIRDRVPAVFEQSETFGSIPGLHRRFRRPNLKCRFRLRNHDFRHHCLRLEVRLWADAV